MPIWLFENNRSQMIDVSFIKPYQNAKNYDEILEVFGPRYIENK